MNITLPEMAEVLGISDDSLQNVHEEVVKLVAERDRLARILAVERGDASQAPEGWKVSDNGWTKHIGGTKYWDLDHRSWPLKWRWVLRENDDGYIGNGQCYNTALEAMEAADAALLAE